MKFEGHLPCFECACGEIALGGPKGTLVIDGQLFAECQKCEAIYKFDCRLQQQSFKRGDLIPQNQEQSNEQRSQPTGR
jgi:hypothetical protein